MKQIQTDGCENKGLEEENFVAISSLPVEWKKKPGESEEEYIYRICDNKDAFGNWKTVGEILNKELNYEYTESKYRKAYQSYCKLFNTVGVKFINNDKKYIEEIESKIKELQKERYKFLDQRTAYNKLLRDRARQEEINEIICSAIKDGALPPLDCTIPNTYDADNTTMMISFNDLHCGANLNNYWNTYNTEIMQQRIAEYVAQIKRVQSINKTEDAVVWSNGDAISGMIHKDIRITNKENIIEQVMMAAETIASFLTQIAPYFKKIRYVSVAGNHSRLGNWEESLKDERLDDVVTWYVKARLQNFDNILFEEYDKLDSTIYLVKVKGLNYAGIHGDYDKGVNNLLTLQQMAQKQIYCILSGHLHHNQTGSFQNIQTVMAGSFIGVDDFCISKRILGKPEQIISIVDDRGIICNYNIRFTAGVKF